ncbi:arsenate reductase (glutaredoxin) [Flavobacterium sp. NKUCC04_CG]|uniref:arsenate reductase (glutaredoxin) n=1 Tax=Flavobacterium sp. NKUCC04_CG TaxID=2842121 RepID=UPI001C5B385C|nr:arsenate reductase (glutaredoxin) [Flavobacterium sp. NKUCC04_CG]MBW3520451.1 arsenate reductase (glutaredoxin) [Flavobacterium sp. NKUCC04_CG]
MITIYHNPRCSKSREGIAYLEEKGISFDVIKYLDAPLSKEEIMAVLKKLNIPAMELVRTKEAIWKEQFAGEALTEEKIIEILAQNPKLIERPIVVHDHRAVIARPTEKIDEIL